MSTMIVEVYNAFRKAGVPEKEAQEAAEALANENVATKADMQLMEKKIIEINGEIKILKWMVGLVIAIEVIPLLKTVLV